MAKKRSAKLIMQQRKNFADAKAKLADHVKKNYVEPIKKDIADAKESKAEFGSWEGKISTFLGLAPSQNETRLDHFETGATEHLPENVISMKEFKERKGY